MQVTIRNTTEPEYQKTESLTRESFWDIYKPGCDEHLVLHKIRNSKCFIKELDFIAIYKNEIVGHLICTKAKVISASNVDHEVLCLGPISVLPEFQKKGIGSRLMIQSITVAKESGYSGMILFGNPDYYHRFGFTNAIKYGITTKDGRNFEPFMALELTDNGLKDIKGRFVEDGAYEINSEELSEFEKRFPFRQKHITATQLKL
jgi:predicted N-acetyltransferase YhbS